MSGKKIISILILYCLTPLLLGCGAEPDTQTQWQFLKAIKDDDMELIIKLRTEYHGIGKYSIFVGDLIFNPLLIAAELNKYEILAEILKGEVRINIQDRYGMTALHWAVQNQNIEMAEILINNKIDVNLTDKYKTHPIHIAVFMGRYDITELLLINNANIDGVNMERYSPLSIAVIRKDIKLIKLLLEYGSDPFQIIAGEHNSIIVAALLDTTAVMDFFIKEGYNINGIAYPHEITPLHAAVAKNNFDMVKLLVENGMNVNSRDKENKTPLYFAVQANFGDIAIYLLENGGDPFIKSDMGISPFDLAERSNRDMLKAFENKTGGQGY
jgi:ankyrin repeat protein